MKKNNKRLRKILALMIMLAMIIPNNWGGVSAYSDGGIISEDGLAKNFETQVGASDFAAYLDKNARSLGDGEFEITIKVEGKKRTIEEIRPIDIVFVLDNSGSMKKANVKAANDAILAFMNKLESMVNGEAAIRYGLVTYSDSIKTTKSLGTSKSNIISALPSSSSDGKGGTHTQLGLRNGKSLFDSSSTQKYIVLLTDGVPTYSDKVLNLENIDISLAIPKYGSGHSGNYGTKQGKAPYGSRVGTGNNYKLSSSYKVSGLDIFDNGFATISEARAIKSSGIEIFGVAMALINTNQGINATNSKRVIKDISSPNKFFDSPSFDDLEDKLSLIANSIAGSSIVDGYLLDFMSECVEIMNGASFTVGGKIDAGDVEWDPVDKKFIVSNIDLGQDEFFTLTYKVRLKDECRDGEFKDLNGKTTIYQNPNDNKGKDFRVPQGKGFKPAIKVDKSANLSEFYLGYEIDYRIEVSNVGNVVLSHIEVNDPMFGGSLGSPDSGDLNEDGKLDLDEVWIYERSYTANEEDLEYGFIINEVKVSGKTPTGKEVKDDDKVIIPAKTPVDPGNLSIIKDINEDKALFKELGSLDEEFTFNIRVQLPQEEVEDDVIEPQDLDDQGEGLEDLEVFLVNEENNEEEEQEEDNEEQEQEEDNEEQEQEEVEFLSTLIINDDVDPRLEILGVKVLVNGLEDEDLTDDVVVSGQNVRVSMEIKEKYKGKEIVLQIRAKLTSSVGFDEEVPNKADAKLFNEFEEKSFESNTVRVKAPSEPEDEPEDPKEPEGPGPQPDPDPDPRDPEPEPEPEDPVEEIEVEDEVVEQEEEVIEVEDEVVEQEEEEEIIEIEDEEPPLAELPQTGESDHIGLYLLGGLFIVIGLFTRKRLFV